MKKNNKKRENIYFKNRKKPYWNKKKYNGNEDNRNEYYKDSYKESLTDLNNEDQTLEIDDIDKEEIDEAINEKAKLEDLRLNFSKNKISYKNITFLQNYISDSGRIISIEKSKLNKKFHKKISKEIKKARFLSLIPYTIN